MLRDRYTLSADSCSAISLSNYKTCLGFCYSNPGNFTHLKTMFDELQTSCNSTLSPATRAPTARIRMNGTCVQYAAWADSYFRLKTEKLKRPALSVG